MNKDDDSRSANPPAINGMPGIEPMDLSQRDTLLTTYSGALKLILKHSRPSKESKTYEPSWLHPPDPDA